jgi:hypothetical protein
MSEVISFGSSLDRKNKKIWRDIERDAYKDDPNYIRSMDFLSGKKDDEREYFVLSVDGEYVGRAKADVDINWISKRGENIGFIDSFVINPEYKEDADPLIQRCLSVLKEKEMEEVMVRYNFPAVEYDGYDKPPVFGCPHNPPWYVDLFERNGFVKTKYWVGYRGIAPPDVAATEEGIKMGDDLIEKLNVEIRRLNMWDEDEVKEFNDLVYDVFISHFGWNPSGLLDLEVPHSRLKLLMNNIIFRLIRFNIMVGIDKNDGRMLGFGIYHPNYNSVMRSLGEGPNMLRAFNLLKFPISRCKMAKFEGIGMVKDMRNFGYIKSGIDWAVNFGKDEGYDEVEGGPVIMENMAMMRLIDRGIDMYLGRYSDDIIDITKFKYITLEHEF